MSEQGTPDAGPRETARQIVDRHVGHEEGCPWNVSAVCRCDARDAVDDIAKRIEQHVASLTADLAQARQEIEILRIWRDNTQGQVDDVDQLLQCEDGIVEGVKELQQKLAAAEQARDEARKDAERAKAIWLADADTRQG